MPYLHFEEEQDPHSPRPENLIGVVYYMVSNADSRILAPHRAQARNVAIRRTDAPVSENQRLIVASNINSYAIMVAFVQEAQQIEQSSLVMHCGIVIPLIRPDAESPRA